MKRPVNAELNGLDGLCGLIKSREDYNLGPTSHACHVRKHGDPLSISAGHLENNYVRLVLFKERDSVADMADGRDQIFFGQRRDEGCPLTGVVFDNENGVHVTHSQYVRRHLAAS